MRCKYDRPHLTPHNLVKKWPNSQTDDTFDIVALTQVNDEYAAAGSITSIHSWELNRWMHVHQKGDGDDNA